LFIKFDINDWHWRVINSTSGVLHLLPTHSEEPLALPSGFVESLETREPIAPAIAEVLVKFRANEIVRILAGSFHGRLARVISSSRRSTRVEIAAFAGRDVTLTVPTGDLVAVPPAD
jgi:transcription antitermination factor NusG